MKNVDLRFKQSPHFLYLLPLFFVFHGVAQDPSSVRLTDFLRLWGEYVLASGILFSLGWLFYRNVAKAGLMAFGLMAVHLFFGAIHDGLKTISPQFFLARYSVLLPVLLVAVVLFLFFLKRTKAPFARLFLYLNLLFVLLILLDTPVLFTNQVKPRIVAGLQPCSTCDRPDVYLIVADEYADSTSLANVFGFNNGSFLAALRSRGFYVAKSVSNYNFTPFSIASLFTMDYLPELEGKNSSYPDRLLCASLINQNSMWDFFVKAGYEIKNNSIFKINNVPSAAQQSYFRLGTDFIASHTLMARLRRDLGYHLVTTLKIKSVIDDYVYYMKETNDRLLARHTDDVRQPHDKSQFVYTHLHLPHYPYYFQRDGTPNPNLTAPGNESDKKAYLEYLQYGNRIYLQMIDDILRFSNRPPVILLMSDHGFREFFNPSPAEKKAYFMNLNAVYLPGGDYSRFYEGISGVNQFRVLFNTSFSQQLPLLKDSTSFLEE